MPPPTIPGLGPVLSAIPSFARLSSPLHNLDDLFEMDDIFAPFHPPLQSFVLSTFGGKTTDDGIVLRALAERVGKKAWEGLKTLLRKETDDLDKAEDAEFLAKLCAEKGVKVLYELRA